MRSILDELHLELSDLTALVASFNPVNSLLAANQDSLVQNYIKVRRRFDYASFIVALYTSLEKFIEDLVAAYLRLESQRIAYDCLDERLKEKHIKKSGELLSRRRLGEGRYAEHTPLEIAKNLFDCLNGSSPYSLNEPALLLHDANLRASNIEDLFTMFGIEQVCDIVRRADAMVAWHRDVSFAPLSNEVRRELIEERLRDIVERRNQIAHRGNALDLLGIDDMNEAIGFISSFCKSVYEIVVGRYLKDRYVEKPICAKLILGKEPNRFKKGRVVVVDKPRLRLSVGQPAFVLTSTGARWGRIQSLQLDDRSVLAIEEISPAPNGIGIELDFICPKRTDLYVLDSDDDKIWAPQKANTPTNFEVAT